MINLTLNAKIANMKIQIGYKRWVTIIFLSTNPINYKIYLYMKEVVKTNQRISSIKTDQSGRQNINLS
jgi:hypothetical protein